VPSELAVALVFPAALIALIDWRKGLFAMVVVAFLQDPARKLEVDEPVYFTLLAGIVFATAYIAAQVHTRFFPTQIPGWKHSVRMHFYVFLALVAAQAVNAMLLYGNPVMVGIGALSYLAPLPALLAGYHFALKGGLPSIRRWLTLYLIAALIMLPSILLQYAGFDWRVLGEVGAGIRMYGEGGTLVANAGFFRSSEMAAWHASTAVCVLLLLGSMGRVSATRTLAVIGIVVALLAIGILTGRRKLFVEVSIFFGVYVTLLALFGKGGIKLAVFATLGALLSYVFLTTVVDEQPPTIAGRDAAVFQEYAKRSATVASEITERFSELGLAPVGWAIDSFGWLGGGLGVASQGAQYFGAGAERFGGAGEGGLGKLTAELGVPGLVIMLWVGFAMLRYGWRVLVYVSRRSRPVARLAYGLAAFVIANVAVFSVATQLFGDLYVLLMLGMVAGFLLATPELAEREQAQRGAAQERALLSRPGVQPGAQWALRRASRP
jgi:hypothetical protein